MTSPAAIAVILSAKIMVLVDNGHTVREAIDIVLGDGTYERIASDVYDELRGRNATDH